MGDDEEIGGRVVEGADVVEDAAYRIALPTHEQIQRAVNAERLRGYAITLNCRRDSLECDIRRLTRELENERAERKAAVDQAKAALDKAAEIRVARGNDSLLGWCEWACALAVGVIGLVVQSGDEWYAIFIITLVFFFCAEQLFRGLQTRVKEFLTETYESIVHKK